MQGIAQQFPQSIHERGTLSSAQLDPARLHRLNYGFKRARAAHVAAKLDLFSLLHTRPDGLDQAEVTEALKLSPSAYRGICDFLDLLVAQDLLNRQGTGLQAKYTNSAEADAYLVKGKSDYIGNAFVLSHDRSNMGDTTWTWHVFSDLLPALSHGEIPTMRVPRIADTIYNPNTTASAQSDAQYDFAKGMASINTGAFKTLCGHTETLGLSNAKSVVDIGGSIGQFSVVLAQAHPHLQFVTCDLGSMRQAAERHISEQGLADRITFKELNFLVEEFPPADMVIMSMVLHNWSLKRKKLLVKKAYNALPAGGIFLEVNSIVDDDRRQNVGGLELSLTQLVEFGHEQAFVYTFQELSDWAKEAGFASTELLPLATSGAKRAAVCRKA